MASSRSITGALNASQLANQISATLRQYSNVSQQQDEELAKTLAKKGARKFLSVKSKVSLIMVIVLIVHVASFGIAMIMGSKRYEN